MNSFDQNMLSRFIAGEAMDSAGNRNSLRYIIDCTDPDGHLLKMLKHIKGIANGGHSFDVVTDPEDSQAKKEFFIDGDGPDHIHSISVTQSKYDVTGVLLAAIQRIHSESHPVEGGSREACDKINAICAPLVDGGKEYGKPDAALVDLIYKNFKFILESPDIKSDDERKEKALEELKNSVKYIEEAREQHENVLLGR